MRTDKHPTWEEFSRTKEFGKMQRVFLYDRNGIPILQDDARPDDRVVICRPIGAKSYEITLG